MNLSAFPTWRLIDTGCLDAYSNMAMDEALLRSFDTSTSLPILRLYGWEPAALSLGKFQRVDEVLNLQRCQDDGVQIVRRITGGGVIYHADELTYSIVCSPGQIPPASSIKDSFRILTRFLLEFYRRRGLDAQHALDVMPSGSRLGERTDFCFAGRESYDILISGKKIGGNAQRRCREIIFQHGSIPLTNHATKGMTYMRKQLSGCEQGVVSLVECGSVPDREQLYGEIASVFSSSFAVELVRDILSPVELRHFNRFKCSKYGTNRWNMEGAGE
ncbi:MAG: lipoate--protein ligase family protein [Desulfuromonadales bacterium]|nr:lipoate--protein ligase family protein [Desulfuromonadales bacterium]